MKTLKITIITAVLLMAAQMQAQNYKNLPRKEKQAFYDEIIRVNLKNEGTIRDLKKAKNQSEQAAESKDDERQKCLAESAYDGGGVCNGTDQGQKTDESDISTVQKGQIKNDLQNFINAIISYNDALKKWNNANTEATQKKRENYRAGEELQKKANSDYLIQVSKAGSTAMSYGEKLRNNSNVSQALRNKVGEINRKIETQAHVNDLEAIQSFFENDCDACVNKQ